MQYVIVANEMKYQEQMQIKKSELKIQVKGYTELKKGGSLFRATDNYRGSVWYDWALVTFPPTVNSTGNETCAAQIIGIFQYLEASSLTFRKIEMDGLSGEHCTTTVDDTLYVALRCQ